MPFKNPGEDEFMTQAEKDCVQVEYSCSDKETT